MKNQEDVGQGDLGNCEPFNLLSNHYIKRSFLIFHHHLSLSHALRKAHLVSDETVAHRALLALVGQAVLVVVHFTLVTLITNKPLATRTRPIVMALHQG